MGNKRDQIVASHWLAGLLPVLCLGVLIWISETSTGPKPLRAASGDRGIVDLLSDPFFETKVETEMVPVIALPKFVYQKTLKAKVTAYTPGKESCGIYADGLTSTGKNAWNLDGVAADPSVLPYGTILFIPGVGYREVDDTGVAMRDAWKNEKNIHIDLRFADVSEARKWGVQQLPIHIFLPE